MAKIASTVWDPAEHLKTEEDMAAYLEAALAEGDSAVVAAALGDIARAKGMTQDAQISETKHDMRAEYRREDLGNGVRGKYFARVAEGTKFVLLDDKVAKSQRSKPNEEA